MVKQTLQMKDRAFSFFSTDYRNIFEVIVGNKIGVMLRRKGPHKLEFAYDFVRIHCLVVYTGLVEYETVGDTKTSLLRRLPILKSKARGYFYHWTVDELSDNLQLAMQTTSQKFFSW